MYDVILVATHGSDPANRAVEFGLELAEQYDAVVHAISVVDTARYGEPALSSTELIVEELEDNANELLAEIVERGDRRGVEVITKCTHGDPHVEIVEYADVVDADVTILGAHGLSHTGHHIGSVSDRVVRDTDRPVMLT
jgi:nucleotide-binding universal stress UspA family protein